MLFSALMNPTQLSLGGEFSGLCQQFGIRC
jgi:hypothetical protein